MVMVTTVAEAAAGTVTAVDVMIAKTHRRGTELRRHNHTRILVLDVNEFEAVEVQPLTHCEVGVSNKNQAFTRQRREGSIACTEQLRAVGRASDHSV